VRPSFTLPSKTGLKVDKHSVAEGLTKIVPNCTIFCAFPFPFLFYPVSVLWAIYEDPLFQNEAPERRSLRGKGLQLLILLKGRFSLILPPGQDKISVLARF
jgi:hypothetical protein